MMQYKQCSFLSVKIEDMQFFGQTYHVRRIILAILSPNNSQKNETAA